MNARALLLVVVVLGVAGTCALGIPRLEGTPPSIDSPAEAIVGSSERTLEIELRDEGAGLRGYEVRLLHPSGTMTIAERDYPGGWLGGGAPGTDQDRISIPLDARRLGVPDGAATLVVTARDWSWRDGFSGNRGETNVSIQIDTRPPRVNVESGRTYVYRGGSGAVVYRTLEPTQRDGVQVGDTFFPGQPLPDDGASDEQGDRRVALFAIPVDAPPSPPIRVVAEDLAGNEGAGSFPVHVFERRFAGSSIRLSDRFLDGVVRQLAADQGIDASDPVAAFKEINTTLRARNEEQIRAVLPEAGTPQRWEGAFEQMRNSQVTSRFAERRTYVHGDRPVSEAVHFGFDLASTAAAPVTASNAGTVLLAEPLGIYGNCVVIDHGMGLTSLYAHLSNLDVVAGDEVTKGQLLGLSGATGLAGGDHLHFAILVGGTYVDPLEWWDPKWVRAHVDVRVTPGAVTLTLRAELAARFVRRYKRFFADVQTADGRVLTVHCANPGSMRGFHRPGAAVRCSTHDNPKRKLRHTLEMMRIGRVWVGLNTHRANQVAEQALRTNSIDAFSGYRDVRREVRVGGGSRLDFRLDGHPRRRKPLYVEVKSVTLAEGRVARFPDSVTERGRRHAQTLARLHESGARAALLFLVQRGDCEAVAPADDIDPAYGEALRDAVRRGVEVHAVAARVTSRAIALEDALPVRL